jgi:hypothetical protein
MTITFKSTKRGMSISASGIDANALFRAMTSKPAKLNPNIAVAAWNNAVNVGQWVDYRSYPEADPVRFKTRSRAEVLSGHTPVVWLEGKCGCVTLESLTLVPVVEGGEA